MLDLLIVGSGPAALTAAVYAARANLSVTVYERAKIGGELPNISKIGNFPGFLGDGAELAESMRAQAEHFGVKIEYGNVEKINAKANCYSAAVDGELIEAKAVLLATGSEPVQLSFTPAPPVSYCALCDAELYKGKEILVVGGGNSAVGEAIMLASIAKQVTIMTHSRLKAEESRVVKLRSMQNVKIIENTEPTPENTSGYDGIFVYIGKCPATSLLEKNEKDELGYALTIDGTHQVKNGIFAAGDVRSGTTKQAVTAAADGAEAAIEIIKYLEKNGK